MTKVENKKIRHAIACFMEDEPVKMGGWQTGMDIISDLVMADTKRRNRKVTTK